MIKNYSDFLVEKKEESHKNITVLYGIHSNVPDQKITSIIDKYKYKDFNFSMKANSYLF